MKNLRKQYPLAHPFIGATEERYVLDVLRSGRLSIGPYTEAFEKAFAKKLGVKHAVAVSSGTTGLHLALIAAGVGKGDEVITSPFSFVASANAILYVGAKPVFIDVDPVTLNIDPSQIEKRITKRTKAIMPIHIFGQPARMDEIMAIAKRHKLAVIEDACESLLATYRGKKAGTIGQSGVFAFYANKQMTTGEGGMIATNSARVAALCRSLRNQGRGPDMRWLDHVRLGFNYRMDEMSAALGLAQLKNLSFLMRKRSEVAHWYSAELLRIADLVDIPVVGRSATHTWFVYVIRLKKGGGRRDAVMRALAKRGIATKPYVPSIHLFSFYREEFGYRRGDFPVSEHASDSTIALPLYIGLTRQDVKNIVETLRSILASL